MVSSTTPERAQAPGWRRLWRHSYRIGAWWLVHTARRGWPARRSGLARLLVPLDPWRYYEMGTVADHRFDGSCLDVSSPKLLPSMLQREGQGRWTCIDLFKAEVDNWAVLDPSLTLAVEDATQLSFPADSFDHVVCLSVLEHIGHGGDVAALHEMWRVLRPGGTLHLTTDVAVEPRDVTLSEPIYGEASESSDTGGYFFKHDYGVAELEGLVAQDSWSVTHREFAAQRNPRIERWFYRYAPWTYVVGPLLRVVCPKNFYVATSPDVLVGQDHGVIYLVLVKDAAPVPRRGVDE
jgi:SAM-dependent methyltransferase